MMKPTFLIWLILSSLFASALQGAEPTLTGALALTKGQLRRGETLYLGSGATGFVGFGAEEHHLTLWGDNSAGTGFQESGLVYLIGSSWADLSLLGYQQQTSNAKAQLTSEAQLSFHGDRGPGGLFALSYTQVSSPTGKLQWLKLEPGFLVETSDLSWETHLKLWGKKTAQTGPEPHTAQLQTTISFPGLNQWLFLSFAQSFDLKPNRKEPIRTGSSFALGVGHVF